MRTTIGTFADFYRNLPLVLASEENIFYLKFHRDGGNDVDIVRRWRRLGEFFDGLVLKVERTTPDDQPSGQSKWILSIPGDSPTGLQIGDLTDDSGEFFEAGTDCEPGMSVGEVAEGQVLCLHPKNTALQRAYRVMFSTDVPAGPQTPSPQADPPSSTKKIVNLQNLPKEILRMIIGKLPYSSIANEVCFVSREMFAMAKGISNWPVLDMHGCRSLDEVNALAGRAHLTCVTLRAPSHDVFGAEFKPLVDFRWPVLKNLAISFCDMGSSMNVWHLSKAIRTNRLPRLVSLKTYPSSNGVGPIGIEVMDRFTLRGLKDLVIHLEYGSYGTYPLEAHEWERGSVFAGVPNLELLHVLVDEDLHGCYGVNSIFSQAFAAGHLSKLKELKIECVDTLERWDPDHDTQLESAPPTAVERLSLNCMYNGGDRMHAGVFFKRFPGLKSLQLRGGIQLAHWESVPASSLKNIKQLWLLDALHGDAGIGQVPFSLMTSLEAASVGITTNGEAPREHQLVDMPRQHLPTALLLHPKLTILRLEFGDGLKCLASSLAALPREASGILSLELGGKVDCQSFVDLELLSKCFLALPNLARISFGMVYHSDRDFYPGVLARVLSQNSLQRVEVIYPGEPDDDDHPRWVNLMEETASMLPGDDWTTSTGFLDALRETATVRLSKTGGVQLANDLFNFDADPFFRCIED